MRQVKVIQKQGESTLVEWTNDDGRPRRAIIPTVFVSSDGVDSGLADDEKLQQGIDSSGNWEVVIGKIAVNQDVIADALRRAGFWDWHDIERDPRGAQKAISDAIGVQAARLARLAKTMEV